MLSRARGSRQGARATSLDAGAGDRVCNPDDVAAVTTPRRT
jgi:hypothetical protein